MLDQLAETVVVEAAVIKHRGVTMAGSDPVIMVMVKIEWE